MLRGWKITQHVWNVMSAFRDSIPQLSQKCGVYTDAKNGSENVLEPAPSNGFSFFSSFRSETLPGGSALWLCFRTSRELSPGTGHSQTLDITQTHCLRFPIWHPLKPGRRSAVSRPASSRPISSLQWVCVHLPSHLPLEASSQHPAPVPQPSPSPTALLKFLKAGGTGPVQPQTLPAFSSGSLSVPLTLQVHSRNSAGAP